jgi:hypothetical protein
VKKKISLQLNREVLRQLTPAQTREAAGGSARPTCYVATGASCDCTQICVG